MGYMELRQWSECYDASGLGKHKCNMVCCDYQKQVGIKVQEGQDECSF